MTTPTAIRRLIGIQFISLVFAAMLAPAAALAEVDDAEPPANQAVERLERAMSNLNLSDAQKAQLRSLTENHRQATAGLREQIRAARETIANTPASDPNRSAIVAEARRNLESARDQLRTQQEQLRQSARGLLTAEQVNALEARRAERAQQRGERGAGQSGKRQRRFD